MKPLALALALACIGCGAPPPMQPTSALVPPTAPSAEPSAVHPLARAMPADVLAFATMPGTARLSDVVAQIVEGTDLVDLIGREVADATPSSRDDVTTFLRDLEGLAVGLTAERQLLVALHTTDESGADHLLADEATFEPLSKDDDVRRYRIRSDRPKLADVEVHWRRARRLILVGEPAALASSSRALDGKASLAETPVFTAASERFAANPAVNVYVDLPAFAKLSPKELPFELLSPLVLSLTLDDAVALHASATIGGDTLPSTASHASPPPLTLPATLPGDTIAFVAYSSRVGGRPERKGPVLLDALAALDASAAKGMVLGAKAFGVDLSRTLGAFGDEGTIGLVLPPASKLEASDRHWDGALLIARQRLRDRDAVAALLGRARDALAMSRRVKVEPLRDGFFARSNEENVGAAIAVRGDQLVVTFGESDGAKSLLDARGRPLGQDESYQRLASRFDGEHVGVWFDLQRTLGALSRNMPDDANELLSLPRNSGDRPIGGLSLGWRPEGNGWRVHATMHDAATLGVVSALMIYGVRRYLAASKTAEAKNTIAAITRGAVAAYERDGGPTRHRLCGSAEPVPSTVPSGQRYQPSSRPDEDFQRGDDTQGWPCLKFSLTQSHYYRYTYRQGSGYLGPPRGGPDPGPNGFEIAAEGDLDADGVTSLFTMTGQVDPTTGELVVADQIFIDAELE